MPSSTFGQFLQSLLGYESGWDRPRYDKGIILESELDDWAGGSVAEFFPGYESWGQLTDTEWEEMSYRSKNSLGFVGYQFGEALLIDLGYYDADVFYGSGAPVNTWTGSWTGKNGIDSLDAFLTADAQEVAIREAFGLNLGLISDGLAEHGRAIEDFLGTTATYHQDGAPVTVQLTQSGLLAAAHLGGATAVVDLLLNGAVAQDEYGTTLLQYVEQYAGFDTPTVADSIAYFQDRLTGDEGLGPQTLPPGMFDGDGITVASADVAVVWVWGTHKVIDDFDPARDTLFIDWFSAEQIDIADTPQGLLLAVPSNQQSLLLSGVTAAQLDPGNVHARDDSVRAELADLAQRGDMPVLLGAATSCEAFGPQAEQAELDWSWGAHRQIVGFDPECDQLVFKSSAPSDILVSQAGGDLVFGLPGNNSSLTLTGIRADQMSRDAFLAADLDSLLDAASPLLQQLQDLGMDLL